jgi:ketosteroid isomerase-like protein
MNVLAGKTQLPKLAAVCIVLGYLMFAPFTQAQSGNRADADALVREVVTTSLMSWETLVEEEFAETAHPDLVFAFPRVRADLEGALKVFRMWKEQYEDTRVYIHQILVDGNLFSAEYQFATTKRESGKRTVMGTIAIGELRDGRIVMLKEYTDGRVADLQEQGKLPLDEGEEPFPWPKLD